jgi:hypothetical protein
VLAPPERHHTPPLTGFPNQRPPASHPRPYPWAVDPRRTPAIALSLRLWCLDTDKSRTTTCARENRRNTPRSFSSSPHATHPGSFVVAISMGYAPHVSRDASTLHWKPRFVTDASVTTFRRARDHHIAPHDAGRDVGKPRFIREYRAISILIIGWSSVNANRDIREISTAIGTVEIRMRISTSTNTNGE